MSQTLGQDIFDAEGLLERMMGDRELASEILSEFILDLSTQILGLRQSILEGDEKRIVRQIHTIKGASANVGAKGLERLARGAEMDRVETQMDDAEAFVMHLVEQFDVFKNRVAEIGFMKD